MSTYRPKGSSLFVYDFWHKGERFHGPTGQKTRTKADAYERRIRAALAEQGAEAIRVTREDAWIGEHSIDEAFGKWWSEVAEQHASATRYERHAKLWIGLIGADKRMSQIKGSTIATAIAARRKIDYRGKFPSPQTINSFVATFRAMRNYLHDEDRPLPIISWKRFLAPDNERVAYLEDNEQDRLLTSAADVEDWVPLFIEMLALYGMRFGELFQHPDQFDCDDGVLTIPKRNRKGERREVRITLVQTHVPIIAARVARARAAGLRSIWYREVKAHDGSIELQEVTYLEAGRRVRRAFKLAGIKNMRPHDLRHHAGTALLDATGNLKLVQEQLGHVNIKSTVRYAHVKESARRAAIEQVHRNSPKATKRSANKSEQ
jgi:integrase